MTGFIRDVRATLAAAGRPIALMARVAVTPAAATELGFDVAAWPREGLVDAISAGAFLTTQWLVPVDAYKALVGESVAVYACADYTADSRPGMAPRRLSSDPLLLRGFAAGHRAAGADGVELFNFFCAREESWEAGPRDPAFAALGQLRSLADLRAEAKTYTLACGVSQGEVDGPVQVPVDIGFGMMRSFEILLAAEAESVQAQVDVVFTGAGVAAEGIWMHANDSSLGHAQSIEPLPGGSEGVQQATFALPSRVIRDGRNTLTVRNEVNTMVTVLSIDVRVVG